MDTANTTDIFQSHYGANEVPGKESLGKTRSVAIIHSQPHDFDQLQRLQLHTKTTASSSSSSSSSSSYSNSNVFKQHVSTTSSISTSSIMMSVPTSYSKPVATSPQQQQMRCPERPCFLLQNNHFFVFQPDFAAVRLKMNRIISELDSNMDFSYFEDECKWKLKYLNGSDHREIHVSCYWDSNSNDHVVEVKRVKGDGLTPSTNEFYESIRKYMVPVEHYQPSANANRRPIGRLSSGALPMPALKRSGNGGAIVGGVSEEMFLKGIQPIFSMAEDNFFEPRLEAAKALCDMAKRDSKLLELSDCRDNVVRVLNSLLMDEFEDIKQFAVVACAKFCEHQSYVEHFCQMASLNVLIGLIRDVPVGAPTFECAQMRRQAANALSRMACSYSANIRESLALYGYCNLEEWKTHAEMLKDSRTKQYALSVYDACLV